MYLFKFRLIISYSSFCSAIIEQQSIVNNPFFLFLEVSWDNSAKKFEKIFFDFLSEKKSFGTKSLNEFASISSNSDKNDTRLLLYCLR